MKSVTTCRHPGAPQRQGTNVFVTKFDPRIGGKSAIQFSTYLGASGTYLPSGLVVGPDGTAFVVGYGGAGLPSQGGYAGGSSDGFIAAVGK